MKREQLRLYAITDRSYLHGISLLQAVEEAIRGGVSIVQLREKEPDEDALRMEIGQLLPLCHAYGVPLILDDYVRLAAETGCDGVHVGQNDMPADEARQILGPDKIIGVTAKTADQARAAEAAGADYLGSGAMFATDTKPEARPMRLHELQDITRAVSVPVVAIGGITTENAAQLFDTGIAGIAVSEGIFGASDIAGAAAVLRELMRKCQ